MLAGELVNRAWVLSGIVARTLEDVSGEQGTDGIFWLNQLLAEKATDGFFIPYMTHIQFDTVIGQEIYTFPGLSDVDVLTFNIGPVRFEMFRQNRKAYLGAPRVDNIESLPYHYYFERVLGGGNIYLYFIPNIVYQMKLTGRFFLQDVTFNTDLSTVVDKFYVSYLIYELAGRLCDWYKITLPPNTQHQLDSFRKQLANINEKDLTIRKLSTLNKTIQLNWGQVNVGRGYTTP